MPDVVSAQNPEFSSDTSFSFTKLKESEIVFDNAGNTIYINQKYYSENSFLLLEIDAIKEKRKIFYLYNFDAYYIWWIYGGKTEAYKKKAEPEKILQYKNSIFQYSADKISEYISGKATNLDETSLEIKPFEKYNEDNIQIYLLPAVFTDLSGQLKREQYEHISYDRRIIKEKLVYYKPAHKNIMDNNWLLDSSVIKTYQYNPVFPLEIDLPPQEIEFISR